MRWPSRAAVLTLGVAAALTVAAPSTSAGPVPRSDAASVVNAQAEGVLAPAPGDFEHVMGYRPEVARLSDGSARLVNPRGSCSVPGEGRPFNFDVACKAHDFGYDMLRYARHTGVRLPPDARGRIDDRLTADLHTQCLAESTPAACQATVAVFAAGVRFNSWRQVSGPPVYDSGLPRTAGLVLLGGVGLVTPVLGRRQRRGPPAAAAG
jgi:Prokaryotic phospholipase A2